MSADSILKSTITPYEARRAIYIDFEGLPYQPPALLGWLYALGRAASDERLVLRHDVLDRRLWSAACGQLSPIEGVHRYDGEPRSIGQSINSLVRQANKQDRRIVSWSQRELSAVVDAAPARGLLRMFDLNYRDGKATAKRWRSTLHPELKMERDHKGRAHRLVRYAEVIGVEMPERYDLGETAGRITSVVGALEAVESFDLLDVEIQREWSDVLFHNVIDLVMLRSVTVRAADDLALLRCER